jgi:hypothetical protein
MSGAAMVYRASSTASRATSTRMLTRYGRTHGPRRFTIEKHWDYFPAQALHAWKLAMPLASRLWSAKNSPGVDSGAQPGQPGLPWQIARGCSSTGLARRGIFFLHYPQGLGAPAFCRAFRRFAFERDSRNRV